MTPAHLGRYGTVEERFQRSVSPEPNTGCWFWAGSYSNGYGVTTRDGIRIRTHRLSWELFRGPIPEGLWVLHKCDQPACVNPDHLFLGTRSDNMLDCYRKGRFWTQRPGVDLRRLRLRKTHCFRGHPLEGENLICPDSGRRRCRACHNLLNRLHRAKEASLR